MRGPLFAANSLAISPYGVHTRDRRPLRPFRTARKLFREKQGVQDPPAPSSPGKQPQGHSVIMVRDNFDNIPEAPLPEGYRIRTMTREDAGVWTDIWRDADPYIHISRDMFLGQFGAAIHTLPWRGFIVEDEKGVAVATIVAWFKDLPETTEYGRLHWLAVRPAHQGKGLAKVLCSHVLKALAQWHEKAMLDTDSERKGAIALYEKFGFRKVVV
jgi:ribosomal protein S18 acetylase RimI-like enzyme